MRWLDTGIRYLLPIATISSLTAAAVLAAAFVLMPSDPMPVRASAVLAGDDIPADPPPGEGLARPVELAADVGTPSDQEAIGPELEPVERPPDPTPIPGPPGVTAPVQPRQAVELPIVMYHHVGHLPPKPDAIRRDLTVSPAEFEKQLQHFKAQAIETVDLDAVMDHLAGRATLPPKAVALTFDDGYDDNFEFAFPLLKQYGMTGTFFVTTGFIEKPGYVSWNQLKEMAARGMSIQAHSVDHSDLTAVSPAQLNRQLTEPKQTLEEGLGVAVRFLAYPAGKFNRGVIQATRNAGYQAAVTVQHGTRLTAAAPFELPRVRARGSDSVEQLATKMTPPSWRNLSRQ